MAGFGDAVANHADAHGHRHGDDHPHRSNAAGQGQLLLIPDGHKAHQNVGHAEVAQAPGQHGEDVDSGVGFGGTGNRVVGLEEAEVSVHRLGVLHHGVHAARLVDAEHGDDHQSHGHNDGLDEVHGGHSGEAAHRGVADDDQGADDDSQHVVPAKQAVEQLADGGQARGHIGDEEDENNEGGDAHNDGPLLLIALGDERGDGDGVQLHAVTADAFGHQQEVEIGAQSQTNGSPAGVSHAAEVGHAGQAHQQPGGHVAGLGAHGGDQRADAAAAQIKPFGAFLAPAADQHAGADDKTEVEDNGRGDKHLCACHAELSFCFTYLPFRTHFGTAMGTL